MTTRQKITLQDTGNTAIVKLSCGNIGATTALLTVAGTHRFIDPQGDCVLMLCMLDDWDIYGPRLWMLYKDVCKQNPIDFVGMIRAHQLGFITRPQLNRAIDNYGEGLDVPKVMERVRETLTGFTKETDADELCRQIDESEAPQDKEGDPKGSI